MPPLRNISPNNIEKNSYKYNSYFMSFNIQLNHLTLIIY